MLTQTSKYPKKKWVVNEIEINNKYNFPNLDINNSLKQLLLQRNINDIESANNYFDMKISNLHNPFLMKDMQKAVDRINYAINSNQKILIYGDYDVDGTTAVASMYIFLNNIYNNIEYYIPDRYNEGYGISYQGIDYAYENNILLVIALDCGTKDVEKIEYAKSKNIDFIVCDHHTPGKILPSSVALLNPKQIDCNYPYKELSGCGVGFKLCQAISIINNIDDRILFSTIDLVGISTACDIVHLTGENRLLLKLGLVKMKKNPMLSIKYLIEYSNIEKSKNITTYDLLFKIGPRINAAGRMGSATNAVKLLISNNEKEIIELCNLLNNENDNRRNTEKEILEECKNIIENNNYNNKKTLVLYNPNWHKGVIGIVASRIVELYYKPTIIITKSNNVLAGSGRSIKDFNIYNSLESSKEFIEQFGGHFYACGLTLQESNLLEFQTKFEKVVNTTITEDHLIQKINIDIEIQISDIYNNNSEEIPNFYNEILKFEPFGPKNNKPIFLTRNLIVEKYIIMGKLKNHIKLLLKSNDCDKIITVIAFDMIELSDYLTNGDSIIDIVYTLEKNDWNGKSYLQFMLQDILIRK